MKVKKLVLSIVLCFLSLHQLYPLEAFTPLSNKGPDFLILGGWKCGTTSLFHYLKQHPNIQLPKEKELFFFNKSYIRTTYNKGMDWYLEQFPKKGLEQDFFLTGEATAGYLVGANPKEVSEHFPEAKLIILIRNPINRALSHYKMNIRTNEIKDLRPIEEIFIEKMTNYKNALFPKYDPYIYVGIYVLHIQAWRKFYPDNQILVICSEEFFSHPNKVLNDVFAFLGLPAFNLKEHKVFNKGSNDEIILSSDLQQQMSEFYASYNQELQALLKNEMRIDINLASFGWDVEPKTNVKSINNLEN